ncbi:MAG: lactate utilization protein [Kiritimatiellia bacterium]
MAMEQIRKTGAALAKRGFNVVCCATRAEAVAHVMKLAENAATIGQGGSMTLKELGLPDALAAAGKAPVRRADVDLFLLSANALTADGRIVNIDGNGNRVAASINGPRKVCYVIGRNKIVEGGVDDAIARIKKCACPPNCRRLGKKTPCAETGVCGDCDSPDRICKVTAVFDRKPTGVAADVVLVDEDLGY